MNIISFGDIHEDTQNLSKLPDELQAADIIIISGDLTNYHGKASAEAVINRIRKHNNNILAQPGNLDQGEVSDYLSSEKINLHGNGYIFGNVGIFGVGGSNQTPFNTPTEYSEDEIKGFLYSGYKKIEECKIKIMVPHMPPNNTNVDKVASGMHVGSKSVREFIEEYKPDICICGHIHEARGKDFIGNTIILNAGMFGDGGYIEIICGDGDLKAELKKIA
ncbi:MAG: metallophosphoesterase [Candidatus Anammoxibacter sp.]